MPQAWPADAVERRPVETLTPYARNARTHSPAQIDQLAASIEQWGWTIPVLVDEAGTLIAGHGRVLAARQLGIVEVPVMVARGWSEAQTRAYVIADNQLAANAGWDEDLLRFELAGIKAADFDLGLLGFSVDALADLDTPAGGAAPADDDGAGGYSEQYGVIVLCADAGEQERVFNDLTAQGLKLKVVTT